MKPDGRIYYWNFVYTPISFRDLWLKYLIKKGIYSIPKGKI